MKNFVIAVLLVVALALGAFGLHQRSQLTRTRTQLAASEKRWQERSETDQDAARAEIKSQALQKALVETSAYANEKSAQAAQLEQSLAAAKTNNPMGGLGAMFKDPKMREMMKAQQKAYLGPMIERQYAALFQQLNLTSDQAAQLKELLQQKMLVAADIGMDMLDSDLNAEKRAELAKQIKSQTDDYDAQIKEFLGDSYPAFEAYEKTTPDRMAVGQFSDQLAGGNMSLTPDQQQQLIAVMSEERNAFKWTIDYSNQNPADGNFASMFTEEKISQFEQEKERLDGLTLGRAKPILRPEQYQEFEQFLAMQRQMQIAGMRMAAQMFAPRSQ